MPVYVPNVIPGDEIEFKVVKVDKRRAYGKLITLHQPSKDRVASKCSVADQCGGCQLQHQSQDGQVAFKAKLLTDRLSRYVVLDGVKIEPMIVGDRQWATRNKMQFAFGMSPQGLTIGMYAPRSHRVVDVQYCEVMSAPMNRVLVEIKAWHQQFPVPVFNEQTGEGVLRHVSIRQSYVTGQLMVMITTAESYDLSTLIDRLKDLPGMTSIYTSVQGDKTVDNVLGDDLIFAWGDEYIEDVVHGCACRVLPGSFMQANGVLVNRLYQTIVKQVQHDRVLDLYCGTGILTCSIAKSYSGVVGVDFNPAAIEDARVNAAKNAVSAQFECCDVIDYLDQLPSGPATVILDPPRQGCHSSVLAGIIQNQLDQVIYVSCYPDTLGRDLRDLVAGGYVIESIQGVDMFCHTPHIECVVSLSLK